MSRIFHQVDTRKSNHTAFLAALGGQWLKKKEKKPLLLQIQKLKRERKISSKYFKFQNRKRISLSNKEIRK